MHATDWLSFAFSFAIVLALLGVLLYAMKRLQNGNLLGLPQRRMRIIESLSVAPRQKIMLVRVKEEDILIGVTVQSINLLASFPLTAEELAADIAPQTVHAQSDAVSPLAKRFAYLIKSAQKKDKA